jgi:hypothetical protein
LEYAVDHLISMSLDGHDGHLTVFEVDPAAEPGLGLAGGHDGKAARARMSFDTALNEVRPALVKVAELVRQLAPSEAEVEFGLKVGGETGIIIAKGTTEVNFAVKLTWKV